MHGHGSHRTHEQIHRSQENCTRGHFEKERFGCYCYPNYDGEFCEIHLEYVGTYALIGNIVGSIGMLLPIYWISLRILFLVKRRLFQWNLNVASLLLTMIACVFRLVWCIIPVNGFQLDFDHGHFEIALLSLLDAMPTCLWLCVTFLILGFWFDIIKAKLAKGIATRTRVVCVVMAVVSLLYIPGALVRKIQGFAIISNTLMITPLIVAVFGLFGMTLIVSFHSTVSYSSQMKKKKKMMVRRLWVGNLFWYAYMIANFFYGYENLLDSAMHSLTIIRFVYHIIEIGIALSITSMVDQKTNIISLTKWLFGGVDIEEKMTRSDAQSSRSRHGAASSTPSNTTDNMSVPSMESFSITIAPTYSPELGGDSISHWSDQSEFTSSNGVDMKDSKRERLQKKKAAKASSKKRSLEKNSKKASKKKEKERKKESGRGTMKVDSKDLSSESTSV